MVDRVHILSEDMRFLSEPSLSSCFSDDDILMLFVSELTDSRETVLVEFPDFSGWQLDEDNLEQCILTGDARV